MCIAERPLPSDVMDYLALIKLKSVLGFTIAVCGEGHAGESGRERDREIKVKFSQSSNLLAERNGVIGPRVAAKV